VLNEPFESKDDRIKGSGGCTEGGFDPVVVSVDGACWFELVSGVVVRVGGGLAGGIFVGVKSGLNGVAFVLDEGSCS